MRKDHRNVVFFIKMLNSSIVYFNILIFCILTHYQLIVYNKNISFIQEVMWLDYFIASKEEVLAFLEEINKLTIKESFNINKQMILDLNKPENNATLIDLEFGRNDVLREIQTLSLRNYYQSVPDLLRNDNIPYYVFFKEINNREVYIKVKLKNNRIIICKSFHYANYSHGNYPY